MSAIESLKHLSRNFQSISHLKELPTPKVFKKKNEILSNYSGVQSKKPSVIDLSETEQRFITCVEKNTWTEISNKDWRNLPWLLWKSENPLILSNAIVEKYVSFLNSITSQRYLKTLIFVYLRNYSADMPSATLIQNTIKNKLDSTQKGSLLAWKEKSDKFALFDGIQAENRLAKRVIGTSSDISAILEEAGLTGELSKTGLVEQTYSHALEKIKDLPATKINNRIIENIIQWSSFESGLRFPGDKRLTIDALLLPWANEEPSDETKQTILQFLSRHFGDPRLSSGSWHAGSDDARSIIRKWLVKETLEDFFRILDKTAIDSQWKYRRVFWLAYYNAGVIDDAWIALGPDAKYTAKKAFGDKFTSALLYGNGVKSDHSVLLLKISNLIIAEWSHNGKCRVWYDDDENCPKLHQKEYPRWKLIDNSNQIVDRYVQAGLSHQNSEGGHWQGLLSSYIRNETGISMSYSEYMSGV